MKRKGGGAIRKTAAVLAVVAAIWTAVASERFANMDAMVPGFEEWFREQRQAATTTQERGALASKHAIVLSRYVTAEQIQKWLAMRWVMLGFALVFAVIGIGLWLHAGRWIAMVLALSGVGLAVAGLVLVVYIPLGGLLVTFVVAPMAAFPWKRARPE